MNSASTQLQLLVTSRKFQDYNISPTRSIYTFRQQANLSPSGRGTRRKRRRLRVSRVSGYYKGKSITGGKPHMQCTCMHAHSPGSGTTVRPTTARARVRELCFDPPTAIRVTSTKFQDYNISLTRSIPFGSKPTCRPLAVAPGEGGD